jgi:hypothetical protein
MADLKTLTMFLEFIISLKLVEWKVVISIYLMIAINLQKPITTSTASYGGLYWLNDTLFFQNNADGIEGKLVVSKTEGEDSNKAKTTRMTR